MENEKQGQRSHIYQGTRDGGDTGEHREKTDNTGEYRVIQGSTGGSQGETGEYRVIHGNTG